MLLLKALGKNPEGLPQSVKGLLDEATKDMRAIAGKPNFKPEYDPRCASPSRAATDSPARCSRPRERENHRRPGSDSLAASQVDFDAALFGQYAIDLGSLGDSARGAVANGGSGDSTGYAELVFSSGPLEELVVFSSDNAIQTADARSIAQKVASYIDSAGLGS